MQRNLIGNDRCFKLVTSVNNGPAFTRNLAKMKKKMPSKSIDNVQKRILVIRGRKVILDADLSMIYGVSTKRLNEQVRRNIKRFPDDFMFKLTAEEKKRWSQIATT